MYRIMIVEDDEALAQTVKKHLESWGNEVRAVSDFMDVIGEFSSFSPQLVLLDIMLPFYNGFHWCSEIRRRSGVPIIFLSSASDNMNIVLAVNMGGDDFVAKPFDLNVLTAKVQALLRRTYDMTGSTPILEHRGAVLNLDDMSVSHGADRAELTKNEFRILRTLLESKGRVVSRDTLMTRLWETDSYVEENTLTVNIGRLRKKLEGIGLPDFILTKVGGGYIAGNSADEKNGCGNEG